METRIKLRVARLAVLVIGALMILFFTAREINVDRRAAIDNQTVTASRLGPDDVYDVNHIPFHIIGKTFTFTGGSKDGRELRFNPNTGATVTVDATPGTEFELFDKTFAVTKYDANTDIVHIKRLAEE